jgi:hypothetical protein
MKLLSIIALIGAGVTLLLALLARIFFDGRIIISFIWYFQSTGLLLLASIALSLIHLINLKSK